MANGTVKLKPMVAREIKEESMLLRDSRSERTARPEDS